MDRINQGKNGHMEVIMDRYKIKPGQKVKLSEWDPNNQSAFDGDKAKAGQVLSQLKKRLDALQEVLYAENKHKVLIVLQAMDTAGKDGTIRGIFEGTNPQGVLVSNFKVPSEHELDHDYLWRIHQQVPGKGEMMIFNRSHYEDVLVVRVHKLVPWEECKKRYRQISQFERLLAEEGTTILKFYLHIDEAEQKKRLLARIDDPKKNWKFQPGDLKERELWPDYMQAYEDAISKTSTQWAPWYIVPANRKWYRNLVVATVLVEKLTKLGMEYPPTTENLAPYRAQLGEEPASQ